MSENIYKYFPHKTFRPGQDAGISRIHSFLREPTYRGALCAWDPRVGKESIMTSQVLLALDEGLIKKAIFVIPTHAGMINILKEMEAVEHKYDVLPLHSKEALCLWIKDEGIKIESVAGEGCAFELCKAFGRLCPYLDRCPYYEQRKRIPEADVLVCDYNYVFSRFIRKFSGVGDIINEKGVLLLVNEAHMLPRRLEMMHSQSLSSSTLQRALNELEEYGYPHERKQVAELKELLDGLVDENIDTLTLSIKKFSQEIAMLPITEKVFSSGCRSDGLELLRAGNQIQKKKFKNKEGIVSYASMVGNLMSRHHHTEKYHGNKVFFIALKNNLETRYIGWKPLSTKSISRSSLFMFDKFIVYSGTCFPDPHKFRHVLGLDGKGDRIYIPGKIESAFLKNRKDIIFTRDAFFSKNLHKTRLKREILENLKRILERLPKPTAIVATRAWYHALNPKRSLNIPILEEPETQGEVPDWIENQFPKYDYIYFTPHGRLAQSIDLDRLRSMVLLGFPLSSHDAVAMEKRDRMAKSMKGAYGNPKYAANYFSFILPTLAAVFQSASRGLTENDSLTVIYYDARYPKHKKMLNSKNLSICETVDEVLEKIGA